MNLDEGNVGITPDAGREILESKVRDIERQLDDLAMLARRDDIPMGVLRG